MKVFFIILLLSVVFLYNVVNAQKCPINEEDEDDCPIVDPNPKPGEVAGIAAFEYQESSPNRPSNWGNLNCETGRFAIFEDCPYCDNDCSGDKQSPINIIIPDAVKAPISKAPIVLPSLLAPVVFETTPANFELLCRRRPLCGLTKFKGKTFFVDNVHMHYRSEHRLDGKQYPLEMHIVHASGDKNLVVAVFYKEGSFNSVLQKFLDIASKKCHGTLNLFKLLLPAINRKELTTYDGSLTTPPCTEGVQWVVSRKILQASKSQIDTFIKLIGGEINNRPTQPIHDRKVTLYH